MSEYKDIDAQWRNVMPQVASLGRCIAFDLIGFGKSDQPDIEYGYFNHVAFVRGFIEALELKNITFVIHDWGFNYGMEYAVDHEDNIKGICFAESLMAPRYPIVDEEKYESQRPGTLRMYKIMQSPLGEEIVLEHNLFLECVVIEHIYRRINQEAFQYWREPLMDPICRKANLQMPRDVPINGAPAEVCASYDKYNSWFVQDDKKVPTLCVYATPGAVTIESDVEWQQQNIANHETLWIGPGAFMGSTATEKFDLQGLYAGGDKVIALIQEGCKVNATGKSYDILVVHVWTVQDGLIVQFDEVYDSCAVAEAFTS